MSDDRQLQVVTQSLSGAALIVNSQSCNIVILNQSFLYLILLTCLSSFYFKMSSAVVIIIRHFWQLTALSG